MEVTSGSPGKRSRAKVKSAATEEKKPTIVVKKARTPKKVDVAPATVTTTPASAPAARATATQPSVDQIQGMISTAAYYLAAERHFSPGHELDDWLEAERRIHALYG